MQNLNGGNQARIEDEELVRRAREDDPEAASELVSRYRPALVRFCYRYFGHVEESEDVAQDVLGAITADGRWPEGNFRAWVYRLARNRCLNLVKRRQDGWIGAGSILGDSHLPSPHTGPRSASLRKERNEGLRRHLASLTPNQREILVLRYFEDLSRRQIAEVLELSESVVKSRLFEAMRQLQRIMKDTQA